MRSVGQELLNVPMGEMIQSMGLAIAEAQYSLDEIGMRLAQMMSGEYEIETVDPVSGETEVEKRTSYVTFDGEKLSLLELGFTPTFYQFTDTIIEVKISISMSYEHNKSLTKKSKSKSIVGGGIPGIFGGAKMRSSSVSATYSSKYQYSAEGSSLLRTKLSPIPPPAVLEERIRAVIERKQEEAES